MLTMLATETSNEGGGLNLLLVAVVIAAIAAAVYLWKRR